MNKRKRAEILETPAGQRLNILVEEHVFNRNPCLCRQGTHTLSTDNTCLECFGTPVAQWSDSAKATAALRCTIATWGHQRKQRFLDHIGEALSHRLEVGKIDPRQWVLHVLPVDFARAAVLTILSGV